MTTDPRKRLEDISLEATYWRTLLDDLLAINERNSKAAGYLAYATTTLADIAGGTDPARAVEMAVALRLALEDLGEVQDSLLAAVEVARGRHTVLRRELKELQDDELEP
jgi:hypothetical protein